MSNKFLQGGVYRTVGECFWMGFLLHIYPILFTSCTCTHFMRDIRMVFGVFFRGKNNCYFTEAYVNDNFANLGPPSLPLLHHRSSYSAFALESHKWTKHTKCKCCYNYALPATLFPQKDFSIRLNTQRSWKRASLH